MWAELFCLLLQLPDGGFRDRSEARGWAPDLVGPTGRPAHPPLSGDSRCTIPPAHAWSRRHPLGVVGEPAAGRIPSGPSVGGWSRLGASSRPQIGRWDRRQCHMPDFWVTWRPRNPLNASVATFCAAGVISMHQTPPGMVRGVSGVSRGRFVTISTGSQSESGCPGSTVHRICRSVRVSFAKTEHQRPLLYTNPPGVSLNRLELKKHMR